MGTPICPSRKGFLSLDNRPAISIRFPRCAEPVFGAVTAIIGIFLAYEPLTKPNYVVHSDERAADCEESFVDIGSSFISGSLSARLTEPIQGSSDDPGSLTEPNSVTRILMCDDWGNSSIPHCSL